MKAGMRIGIVSGALLTIAVAAFAGFVQHAMDRAINRPIELAKPQLFRIPQGGNAASIGRRLEAQGWIEHYRLFVLRARLDDIANRIKAGTYEIIPGDSLRVFLDRIVAGQTKTFEVTFIEGERFRDMVRVLAAAPQIVATLKGIEESAVMARLGLENAHPEGLFFPATYRYEDDTKDSQVLLRAYHRMQAVLTETWDKRAPDLPYSSPYEALIMASIVEKETARAEEREIIAGVFVRRLKLGMKLQTDPTIIYGLGPAFDGNLRRADLKQDGPYNTYTPPRSAANPNCHAWAGCD